MVTKTGKRVAGLLLIILFVPAAVFGQAVISAQVQTYFGLVYIGSEDWITTAMALGNIDYTYSAQVVKAEINTSMTTDGTATLFGVDAAYAKLKFGETQLTAGLTGLGWGVGTVFNAADLIAADESLSFNLGADSFRPERDLMIAFYLPFDEFIFVEAVVLPAVSIIPTLPLSVTEGQVGLRFQGKWGDLVTEISYLTDGAEYVQKIGLSMQGYLWADWYIGSRLEIPYSIPANPEIWNWITASAGIFNLHDLTDDMSLSWRIEALYKVVGEWEEQNNPTTQYALILYPEISISAYDQTTFFLRGLLSPINWSARSMLGLSWSPAGFWSLFVQASLDAGESTDNFYYDRQGGMVLIGGLEIKY